MKKTTEVYVPGSNRGLMSIYAHEIMDGDSSLDFRGLITRLLGENVVTAYYSFQPLKFNINPLRYFFLETGTICLKRENVYPSEDNPLPPNILRIGLYRCKYLELIKNQNIPAVAETLVVKGVKSITLLQHNTSCDYVYGVKVWMALLQSAENSKSDRYPYKNSHYFVYRNESLPIIRH